MDHRSKRNTKSIGINWLERISFRLDIMRDLVGGDDPLYTQSWDNAIQEALNTIDNLSELKFTEIIHSFGYGVYSLPESKIAIANPLNNVNGYYRVAYKVGDVYWEMRALQLISPGRV